MVIRLNTATKATSAVLAMCLRIACRLFMSVPLTPPSKQNEASLSGSEFGILSAQRLFFDAEPNPKKIQILVSTR